MVGNRLDAEDLTQVFLKAYQFIGTYSGTNLGRWLRKIATNLIDQMRRRRFRRCPGPQCYQKDGDEQPRRLPTIRCRPLRSRINEGESAIMDEINRLPEYYRKVVVLYDVMEKTGEEVAREASCPIGTVKSRLSRAHKFLRSAFESPGLQPSQAGA